jgi:putative FmdB family regulatory protein
MPTYEYVCEGCGHEFEELQSFKDEPLKVCPKCHEERLRRLFGTGAAILFKGSGFYETDYRSESYKKAAKAEQDASSKNGTTKDAAATPSKEGSTGEKKSSEVKSGNTSSST